MASWIVSQDSGGVSIAVQVIPRAHKSEIVGLHGDALKVRLAAPPVEGAANEALVAYLAGRLGLRRREVSLVSGEHSRRKVVRIHGLSADQVAAQLLVGA